MRADPSTLNKEQRTMYDMIVDIIDKLAQGVDVPPTHMLVLGELKISFPMH